MENIKILLIDDHAVLRESIRIALDSQQDIQVVGEAADGQEAIHLIKNVTHDVIVLDISMPAVNGLEVMRIVRETRPSMRVVILTMHERESCVYDALSAGALGYVVKATGMHELLQAIREVHKGRYYLCSRIQNEVIQKYIAARSNSMSSQTADILSKRELQIVRLIADGNVTKDIADMLCISVKTIEKHRSNIMRKLRVKSLAELIKYAVQRGIVDPDLWDQCT